MSGPKYYTFPAGSSEEAAGILSRFSAFQWGVHATVSGNQINVTVSNAAWCAGKDYGYISEQIASARERFRADEEMRRLLESGKSDELRRVRDLKAQINKQADDKKKRLTDAQSRCGALAREAEVSISTPFGTYDMKAYVSQCESLISEIRTGLDNIGAEKSTCLANCDRYSSQVSQCSSLSELSKLQGNAPDMSIPQTLIDKKVEALESEIKERKKQLIAFTQFLRELDRIVGSKGLADYKPRILKTIANLDIYSPSAIQELVQLVEQIEREHAHMQEQLKIKKAGEATLKEVESQIVALGELKSLLKPLVESAEVIQDLQINYEILGRNTLGECEKIIDELEGLKFCSGLNKREIETAKRFLDRSQALLRSPDVYAQLTSLLSKLRDLREECIKEAESYERFSVEYERYKELYMKFRGILSAEDSELVDDDGYLEEPTGIVFEYSNADAQITALAKRNEQLEAIINQSVQQTFSAGMSAILHGSKWGREFRREKRQDESIHLSFVRRSDKGAIFDVSCGQNGEIGIIPRGVILSNGHATITPDELRKIHASCEWADEISKAFEDVGIPNGTYEEMAEEHREELYDEAHYYRIETDAESIRFLRLSGYSDEEIEARGYVLSAEEPVDVEDITQEETSEEAAQATELKPPKH